MKSGNSNSKRITNHQHRHRKSIASQLPKEVKKAFGIFFTPDELVNVALQLVEEHRGNVELTDILEPSCGNGQFLKPLVRMYSNANLTAYELNETVYEELMNDEMLAMYMSSNGSLNGSHTRKANGSLLIPTNNNISSNDSTTSHYRTITILNEDYLASSIDIKYDLIIGNPPYYVTSNRLYADYYTGRANVFVQFIVHSLNKLKPNGLLVFVIPETFLNCVYYERTREYIKNNFEILDVVKNADAFDDTNYSTITFIVRNTNINSNNSRWFYRNVIIHSARLRELIDSHVGTTLNELMIDDQDIHLFVGSFVWNQHKQSLIDITTNINNYPILIYRPNNNTRRSYITEHCDSAIVLHQDSIIINRGYGTNTYDFSHQLIHHQEFEPNGYVCENHLLVIVYDNSSNDPEVLEIIEHLLNSPTTNEFINLYITNGAMNINDLRYNVQLFDDST